MSNIAKSTQEILNKVAAAKNCIKFNTQIDCFKNTNPTTLTFQTKENIRIEIKLYK